MWLPSPSSPRRASAFLFLLSAVSFSFATDSQGVEWQDIAGLDASNDAANWLTRHLNVRSERRSLQTRSTVCNTVLASWNAEEVSTSFFNALGNVSYASFLQFTLQFNYGVQFRTVCASCREAMATLDSTTATSLNSICGSDVYGENATVSGLAMLPLTADGSQLAPGTMKGVVYCHGTRTDSWPSTDFQGANDTSIEILQFAAITSLGGSVVIIPDYMGFGASQGTLYKAYTVLKSYQTSFIPLWYKTKNVLAQESNCASVLGNQAAVVGYSEGGYASVAVAHALSIAGVQVVHVDSGGGPFRVTLSTLSIIKGVDDGTFDLYNRYVFALIGSAYSGTFPLPNSNQTSQYILSSNDRDTFVSLVSDSSSADTLNAQIPESNPFSIFNSQFVSLAQASISAGNFDPCTNSDSQILSLVGPACNALNLNDLTNYLETQVDYPVRLCHSPQDNLVSYANLPNISRNSQYLSLMSSVSGTHQEAAVFCVAQAFLYLMSPDFQSVIVPNEAQSNGCSTPAPSKAPTATAPAQMPNKLPTATQGTPQSPPSSTSTSSYSKGVKLALFFVGATVSLTMLPIL